MVLVVMTTVISSLQGSSGNEMPGPESQSKLQLPGITGSSRVLLLERFGGTLWSVLLAALLTLVSAHFLSVIFQPCQQLYEKPPSVVGAEEL